jgi:hypothetical protein
MTANDVSQLIEAELRGADGGHGHGLDLDRCLVPPKKQIFDDASQQDTTLEMWLVLEEDPVERSAYKIVFHEQRGFGLAVPGSARAVLIGFYGSFVDALEAM